MKKVRNVKKDESFSGQFAQAFHDVVVPVLEDMSGEIKDIKGEVQGIKGEFKVMQEDIKTVVDRVEGLDNRVERMNRAVIGYGDRHGDKIDDHERRIRKLERASKPDKES